MKCRSRVPNIRKTESSQVPLANQRRPAVAAGPDAHRWPPEEAAHPQSVPGADNLPPRPHLLGGVSADGAQVLGSLHGDHARHGGGGGGALGRQVGGQAGSGHRQLAAANHIRLLVNSDREIGEILSLYSGFYKYIEMYDFE